jgi:hypothetical protein
MGFRHVFGVENFGDLSFGEEIFFAGQGYDARAGCEKLARARVVWAP